MVYRWKKGEAEARINARIEDVEDVEIVEYKRDMSLQNIPINCAYRVKGVHLYADIVNLDEMLGTEAETAHKRALRFLNQHYRAVHRILNRVEAIRVDFHNQRLHAVVAKPYDTEDGAEAMRVHRAVAIAQLIIDVLRETGSEEDKIEPAQVRVGIDTGTALAVNNGRAGYREPLFLGRPANHAAKRAGGGAEVGIFLTNDARKVIGLPALNDEDGTPLSAAQVAVSQKKANLGVSKDEIVEEWRQDLDDNPIGAFEFTRHSPPFRDLVIEDLTPANSRRQEAISCYADIDGFTAYVDRHINDNAEDVVRCFHVIRAEMDAVLSMDFGGRKIRFIGDCLHGVMAEGTAFTTEEEETVSAAVLCAGGLRSSFNLTRQKLEVAGVAVDGLGLQIGLEYGMITVTRLGMKGDRIRCSVSRSILASEAEQGRCAANDTAIGEAAYNAGTEAVRNLFGSSRIVSDLDYDVAVLELENDGDKTAKRAKQAAAAVVYTPAAARSLEAPVRSHARLPGA